MDRVGLIILLFLFTGCSCYKQSKSKECPDGINCRDGTIIFKKNHAHFNKRHKQLINFMIKRAELSDSSMVFLDLYLSNSSTEKVKVSCRRFKKVENYIKKHCHKKILFTYNIIAENDNTLKNFCFLGYGLGNSKNFYLSGSTLFMHYNGEINEGLKGRLSKLECCR